MPNQLLIQNKNEEIADLQQQLMGKQTENDRLTERTVTLEVEKQHFEEELTQLRRHIEESRIVSQDYAQRCADLEEIKRDIVLRLQRELEQTVLDNSSLKTRYEDLETLHHEQEISLHRRLEESSSAHYILSERNAELEKKQDQEMANLLQQASNEDHFESS